MANPPLLTVVGPTASGKTALALRLARDLQGEIISADSRQIYRRLDIGTAKPTPEEQALAPHHLLDVVDPDEVLTLAEFQERAWAAISEIHGRDHLPLLVGGTGQWVKAVLLVLWGTLVIGMIDNFLRPKLVGVRTKLHELLIFFAVLGGLQVFGVLGIVLGPVVLAITLALVDVFRAAGQPVET